MDVERGPQLNPKAVAAVKMVLFSNPPGFAVVVQ
jgi:hypothetical protein